MAIIKWVIRNLNTYLFILCPPFSGSTLLWRLVATSPAVSTLPSEGQFLPEVENIMRKNPWNADVLLPWEMIKEVWEGYWDLERPILVEKSPPNLLRTGEIVKYFNPIYFLLMVRNPYAHCEGIIRRKWDAKEAAEFAVRCLRLQAENVKKLKNVLSLTYEELVENPENLSKKIQSFIPQIGDLNYQESFSLHSIDGTIKRSIVNLNKKKIYNLSINDLKQINVVFKANADIIDYWGYQYYEPSFYHAFTFIGTRSNLLASAVLTKGRNGMAKLYNMLIKNLAP